LGLSFIVPINRPHRIKVKEITDERVTTTIPYRRKNFNHIKGIHACGLATAAEFASGLLLLSKLNPATYRLIMQSIQMDYHYQAKSTTNATFKASEKWIKEQIIQPLKTQDSITLKCEILLHDSTDNHIATGTINWQIKNWEKVKTKV